MNCPNCNTPLQPGMTACPVCGRPVYGAQPAYPNNPQSGFQFKTGYETWFKVCAWIVVVLLGLSLFASLIGMIYSAVAGTVIFGAAGAALMIFRSIFGMVATALRFSGFLMLVLEKGNQKTALILIGVGCGIATITTLVTYGIWGLLMIPFMLLIDIGAIVLVATDHA